MFGKTQREKRLREHDAEEAQARYERNKRAGKTICARIADLKKVPRANLPDAVFLLFMEAKQQSELLRRSIKDRTHYDFSFGGMTSRVGCQGRALTCDLDQRSMFGLGRTLLLIAERTKDDVGGSSRSRYQLYDFVRQTTIFYDFMCFMAAARYGPALGLNIAAGHISRMSLARCDGKCAATVRRFAQVFPLDQRRRVHRAYLVVYYVMWSMDDSSPESPSLFNIHYSERR